MSERWRKAGARRRAYATGEVVFSEGDAADSLQIVQTGSLEVRHASEEAVLDVVWAGKTLGELVLNAAPMHDIGKLGIPDAILLKSGKLEWEVMKSHTTLGAELLSDSRSEVVQLGRDIALSHHEWWDGAGYPGGLAQTQIPLAGRICAICDVFDALTSPRPYKDLWPADVALAEIRQQSGRHFDPDLVPVFVAMVEAG